MQIITDRSKKELKKHGSDAFPFLVSYEQLSRYAAGSFLWHWHPEIEITSVTKGEMLYMVNQCSFHLKEGELLFNNTNVLHAGFMENMQDCQYVSVTFDAKLVYGFYKSALCQKYVEPMLQDFSLPAVHIDYSSPWHEIFAEKVRNIIEYDRQKHEAYELDIVMELLSVWKCILTNNVPRRIYSPHEKMEHDRIKEIMNYLEKNYMNRISLKDVAAYIHLCESECSRLFKRYMNISLFSFLQEYRIERSLEYLADSGISITEAAARAGFSDPNYYSKIFSKAKGCSPREYRKIWGN